MRAVELPDRAAILARAGESLPAWRARVAVACPRLFFTPESWAGLRDRCVSSTGLGRSYFENALAVARQLATEPAPVYRTPEETMLLEPGLKIFDAQQELWMRPIGDSLVALSFALALADDASIRAKLREVVLAVCAWPQWGTLADLASGHVARGIAVACDWHRAIWSEEELALIRTVIRSRMEAMKEAAYGGLYWAGHYDENHNQVGVCGLGLCGLAFLDEIPEAAEWTALALDNFERVARVSNADGTSAEGVPYWSYGTSFIFQFTEGTRHLLDTAGLYAAPAFRHAIAARLHASTPDLSGTVAWGDSPPRDYYGPHHLLFRLAAEHRDSAGQFLGENLPFAPGGFSDVSVWTALWHDPSVASAAPRALDHHAEVGSLVTSRNGWKSGDYLLAFKAGFTNRNHSHLDAGALAFCVGSEWLLTTPGYGLGKGEAEFWDKAGRRWTYQSNATESQSTLLIGGRNQRFDFEARGTIDAFETTPEICRFSADLTGAYEGAPSARRSVYHRRDEYILVLDEVESAQSETVEWLAQVPVNAETSGHKLRIAGAEGSLEIVSISPALQFTLRPPTSLHLDVPADRLKTFTLTQYGASVRFAVALLPNGKTAPTFTQRDAEILVQGEGWADFLPFP